MTEQVNVLTTGGHRCVHCGLVAKSRSGLRRHQNGEHCRHTQEEQLYARQGYQRVTYNFVRNLRGTRRRVDPYMIERAKRLGVECFDSPSFHWFAYVPTWFWLTWRGWPAKAEGVVRKYSKWVKKRGGGYKTTPITVMGEVPDASFDSVVRAAVADPAALGKLCLRVATGTLDAYLKEGADPA